ncbi:MSHA pilin protein MshA [Oceanisphaera litoralis]|uniref:type II secretion system protein n=1 Tax=Oceanisphaera litoralis TaxID=225144 RepID=UPI00195DFDCC|nr:type II secretion system protein [Oceanisphaera litoralis]MBM7454761.1 MSHA pilin protein MshA [Oceanisphaera litoralis]
MRKTAGFTLIELVIVIVILGILGAVAAPRFINMQGDAYEANVHALNGSIRSAMTLANTKAILDGYDKLGTTAAPQKGQDELSNVDFVQGFPAASEDGIIAMLQDADSFNAATEGTSSYIIEKDDETLTIAPRARGLDGNCTVVYTEAEAAVIASGSGETAVTATPYQPAKTVVDVSGC